MSVLFRYLIKNKICLHNIKSAHVNNMRIELCYEETIQLLYRPRYSNIDYSNTTSSYLTHLLNTDTRVVNKYINIPTNKRSMSSDLDILKQCIRLNN